MRYRLKQLYVTVIREDAPPPRRLSSPGAVALLARDLVARADDDREHFWAVCLDSQNRYLGHFEILVGGAAAAPVDAKVLFRQVLLAGATNLVAIHNHPSGDPTPSREDRALTRQLLDGAELLGLGFHDHVVVGNGTGQWVSMKQRGVL